MSDEEPVDLLWHLKAIQKVIEKHSDPLPHVRNTIGMLVVDAETHGVQAVGPKMPELKPCVCGGKCQQERNQMAGCIVCNNCNYKSPYFIKSDTTIYDHCEWGFRKARNWHNNAMAGDE